ncbi:MAG: Glutathione-regulated potassium-efflux system protein KefC [Phycisphaerae bacterium]|nr:Glutathione-regulated potassium-efflux system protein KefC [Phycisphaerae bacterium]
MDARQRFMIALGLLFSFILIGMAGYMLIEKLGPLDALYMSVITIATVGYRELPDPLSPAGQIFTIGLIIFGVGSGYYAFVLLVTLVVGGELKAFRERQKMHKRIAALQGHVLICGYGRVGKMVVEQLQAQKLEFVILDNAPARLAELERAGMLFVQGDASEESALDQAGISRARVLVATLPHDADNVYVVLTARALNPQLLIIARAESTSSEAKLLRAGADRVVCPQIIGAYRIANLITRPSVVDFVDVASQGVEFQVNEYQVSPDSPWAGKSLREAAIRQQLDAIVVAIRKHTGRTLFNPSAQEQLEAGDTLIMIGQLQTADRLSQL